MPQAPADTPRVLVVEDEVIVAMEIQDRLEHLGFAVTDTLTTGEAALKHVSEEAPDLILMDIRLDGAMDGIETAEAIRAEQDIPVIFLTAYSDDRTLERAKAAAPYGYIVKPFEERELYAAVEVARNIHRLERKLQEQRDDLLQILDGLRQGTAMTDPDGCITFCSRAAGRMLGVPPDAMQGTPWTEAFPLAEATLEALREAATLPPEERTAIPAEVDGTDGRRYRMEIDVQDDPRDSERHIFVMYDVTAVHDLRRMLDEESSYRGMIGTSDAMQEVFRQIEQVAQVNSTALIHGETGTGKELAARAIHNASARADGPFVAVNCAALNRELAGSQLFGHTKGAFTGATSDRPGFFETAEGGTLFLDEIGDIPLEVQRQLLRVLEEEEITRVGETKTRPVDVRILAATHRDLRAEVEAGRFREDMLYRIRIARVELPPLRQRRADIPLLVRALLQDARARLGKEADGIHPDAMRQLISYDWPGNVRELRNAIEYALIRARHAVLQVDDLPPEIASAEDAAATPASDWPDDEEGRIRAALAHTDGNRTEAAELLGMSRATLYRRLDTYGIA